MRLGNIGEDLQHIMYGELESDLCVSVTLGDEVIVVVVLFGELVLHVMPHNLQIKENDSCTNTINYNIDRNVKYL